MSAHAPPGPQPPRRHLGMEEIPTAQLDSAQWQALFDLTRQFVEIDMAGFQRSVREKDTVVIIRDTQGDVVGMGTIHTYPFEHEGRRHWVIFTGNAAFQSRVRGMNIVQQRGALAFLRCRLRNPTAPIWLFYDTFSYRSFLMLSRNFDEYWPRVDRPMPAWERGFLDALCRARYGETWDPTTDVIASAGRRLRDEEGAIRPEQLADPDIRYFAEHNPGYLRGDRIPTLVPLTARNWASVVARAVRRRRSR